jgi:hypothetical protein
VNNRTFFVAAPLLGMLAFACTSNSPSAPQTRVSGSPDSTAPALQPSPPAQGSARGEVGQGSGPLPARDPGAAGGAFPTVNGELPCAARPIGAGAELGCPPPFLASKTLYAPQGDLSTYEPPPSGFVPIFTQLVARHGARGLSSFEDDAVAYAMWQRASADQALTSLGAELGPDILRVMKANALLGSGVRGITAPGYGNLTQIGMDEHRDLAARLLQRLPEYFAELESTAQTSKRSIVVVSSGVDRAVDSAAFFVSSLTAERPLLGSLIAQPLAPSGYPTGSPVEKPAGTNRFLLYFHKLTPELDLVTDATDPYFQTYQSSLSYQAYKDDPGVNAKVDAVKAAPSVLTAARDVLERLFSKAFVDEIEAGTLTFTNTDTFTFASDDGAHSAEIVGDGATTVDNITDAALTLYGLYAIAPGLRTETQGVDFARYLSAADAQLFAYLDDADDFYTKGPGILETGARNYQMGQILLDDFFSEVDAIAAGDLSHGAKLRFTHAEMVIPLVSILGLENLFTPVPDADIYSYDTNPWRGEDVAPMAANIQWDVYRNAEGEVLVKMLRNEKEQEFKRDCDSARIDPGSFYYDFGNLKACYARVPR